MSYPLRTVLRCTHEGQKLGSVVVVRGDPIYDENQNLIGYKDRFLQIRRGELKGNECREFFDSLEDWYHSLGIIQENKITIKDAVMYTLFNLFMVFLTMYLLGQMFCLWNQMKH